MTPDRHIVVNDEVDGAVVFIVLATAEAPCKHGRQQHCTEQHGSEGMGAHVLERMFSFIKSAPPFFTHSSAGVLKGSNDRRASVV